MKFILSVFFLLLFSLLITKSYAQKELKINRSLDKKIKQKEFLPILTKNLIDFPENTQISIALIDGTKTTYIGIIKRKNELFWVDNQNEIFEIGSISKVFTTVLLSHFIHQKKATLQETLQQQFHFSLKNGQNITLQQLANHTSGLPRLPQNIYPLLSLYPNDPYQHYTSKLLENYLEKDVVLAYTTGAKSEYSNLGVGLLGYILTQKSKKSYEDLMQKYIFKPLKMKNSTTLLSNVSQENLIKGRDLQGEIISNWNFTDALVGAGGIKSSASDMVKFIRKNLENTAVYNLPQHATFSINNQRKVGLGWQILLQKNKEILWHNGGTGGYRSCIAINKKGGKGVLVLSNISAFHNASNKIDALCFNLLKVCIINTLSF